MPSEPLIAGSRDATTSQPRTRVAAQPLRGSTSVSPFKNLALLVAYAVLLATVYYLAARLGLRFRFQNSQIGVVWPATAVLFSALWLTSSTRWWLVIIATGLAHVGAVGSSIPDWRIAWQIVGNTVFAGMTVVVLRRLAGSPLHFGSRRQVLLYTLVSFISPAVFGFTTPAFVRSVLHLEPTYTPAMALLRTTLSNATAMLLVAPVILLWAQYGLARLTNLSTRRLVEAVVVMVSLVAAGFVAFGTGPEIARFPSLLLFVFPPLLWTAVRFGPLGASTGLFCIAALSLVGTARQLGPFVLLTHADLVVSLQLFWLVLCPPIMLLAAVIRERDLVEDALQAQRNQLAHVTRVRTVTALSGALAHELSQPLTSIRSNAQAALALMARQPPDLGELREILHDITQQDEQAAGVIARLRTFLKEGESHFEPVGIDAVVRDALKLGHSTIETSGVDMEVDIATGLPGVRGDPVQLLQVMLNLIVNACESMGGVPASDRHLRLKLDRMDQGHVELSVADSGPGLPNGSEDRVFEPFFTTKASGLGLGLAICRSIATTHGGRLWCENNPQTGATFHLVLPTESVK